MSKLGRGLTDPITAGGRVGSHPNSLASERLHHLVGVEICPAAAIAEGPTGAGSPDTSVGWPVRPVWAAGRRSFLPWHAPRR
jgi:hypothetical protein